MDEDTVNRAVWVINAGARANRDRWVDWLLAHIITTNNHHREHCEVATSTFQEHTCPIGNEAKDSCDVDQRSEFEQLTNCDNEGKKRLDERLAHKIREGQRAHGSPDHMERSAVDDQEVEELRTTGIKEERHMLVTENKALGERIEEVEISLSQGHLITCGFSGDRDLPVISENQVSVVESKQKDGMSCAHETVVENQLNMNERLIGEQQDADIKLNSWSVPVSGSHANEDNPKLLNEIFKILATQFLEEIHQICASENGSAPSAASYTTLHSYLTEGRGLALVMGMRRSLVRGQPPPLELITLLLFLSSVLSQKLAEVSESPDWAAAAATAGIATPLFGAQRKQLSVVSKSTSSRRQRGRARGQRHRRQQPQRHSFSGIGFPTEGSGGSRTAERVFENLTVYECDSGSDSEPEPPERRQVVRYKHIDYFQFFDNGDVESEAVVGLSQVAPPASQLSATLPSPLDDGRQGSSLSLLSILDLAANLTASLSPALVVREAERSLVYQNISLASQLAQVEDASTCPLGRSLALRIILNSMASLRYLPDTAHMISSSGVSCCLAGVLGRPALLPVRSWPHICLEVLELFYQIAGLSAQFHNAHPPDLSVFSQICSTLLSVLEEEWMEPAKCPEAAQLLTKILQLPCEEKEASREVWSEIGLRIVSLALSPQFGGCPTSQTDEPPRGAGEVAASSQHGRELLAAIQEFSKRWKATPHVFFVLVGKLETAWRFGERNVLASYLAVLETMALNVLDMWTEEPAVGDPAHTSAHSTGVGFSPYLILLREGDEGVRELALSHVDVITSSLGSQLRLQLATQVILPFLKQAFECIESGRSQVASMLDILSRLVQEQPTAMAFIREQKVWSTVKKLCSSEDDLSTVCQQIIKALILNSHKFKKIRLSEAEAMALQDDEEDRINFDERDRNAQYWLFKQLYHVLVESSSAALVLGWPSAAGHLTSAWQVSLELVRRVPEFFLYALERGITELNVQLTASLLGQPCITHQLAHLLAALTNFLCYVIVCYEAINGDILHVNVASLRETLTLVTFPRVQAVLAAARSDLRLHRILLAGILRSSYVSELDCRAAYQEDWSRLPTTESGYEADDSAIDDIELPAATARKSPGSVYRVVFPDSFHFFIDSLLDLVGGSGTKRQEEEFLYTVEYLLFKLVHSLGPEAKNVRIFHEQEALTRLLSALYNLHSEQLRLESLGKMILELTSHLSTVFLPPSAIRILFHFVSRHGPLQQMFMTAVADMLAAGSRLREFPAVMAVAGQGWTGARCRAVSASSSDSGLCSIHSSGQTSSPVPPPSGDLMCSLQEDLGQEFALVLRLKLAPDIRRDCWLTIFTVENQGETIGLHINVEKGIKITLANNLEAIAAAETTFKSMLATKEWIHLAFNMGTLAEGKRVTKTLTAFVNCQKVWDVGLCVDKLQSKVRKKRELRLAIGPDLPAPDSPYSRLLVSDVHVLKNTTLSQEHVILNYLLGPRDLNGAHTPASINLRELAPGALLDLVGPLCRLLGGDEAASRLLSRHLALARSVVAHFSPTTFWRRELGIAEDHSHQSWTFLDGLLKAGGVEVLMMMPLEAVDRNMPSHIVTATLQSCLAAVTAKQSVYDEFLSMGGFSLLFPLLTATRQHQLSSYSQPMYCNQHHSASSPEFSGTVTSSQLSTSGQDMPNCNQQLPTSSKEFHTPNQHLPTCCHPTTSQQLPTSSQELSTLSQKLPIFSQEPSTPSQQLPTSSQELLTPSQQLPPTSQELPTTTLLTSSQQMPSTQQLLPTLLDYSCVRSIAGERILLYPELVSVCIRSITQMEPVQGEPPITDLWLLVVEFLNHLLADVNPAAELNLLMVTHRQLGSDDSLMGTLLACLLTVAKQSPASSEWLQPLAPALCHLLGSLPCGTHLLRAILDTALGSLPPHMLYLPHLTFSFLLLTAGGHILGGGGGGGLASPSYIDKIHATDVVDVSSALLSPPEAVLQHLVEESAARQTEEIRANMDFTCVNEEVREWEEDRVSEWEVLTRHHSVSPPSTPIHFIGEADRSESLAGLLLPRLVSGYTILSDSDCSQLSDTDFRPETLYPLVYHPSPEVHANALSLIRLILERRGNAKLRASFAADSYSQLAALLQCHAEASPLLVNAVLSLLHEHPVDVNVPFEFNRMSPPDLNIAAGPLLLPLILTTLPSLTLCHNYLCHVHELLANAANLTEALLQEGLLQTLVTALLRLADMPQVESDIYGCDENELLLEDIQNIIRMLVVLYVDKPGSEYDKFLDVLFLAVGLLSPPGLNVECGSWLGSLSPASSNRLRTTVCLILEEALLTIETALGHGLGRVLAPYFQRDEAREVDPPEPQQAVGGAAVSHTLTARLNQILRFSLNYLTSVVTVSSSHQRLIAEEERLGQSILALCLDSCLRSSSQPPLAKGLNDAASLGSVLTLLLLRHGSCKARQLELLMLLGSRAGGSDLLTILLLLLFPDPQQREQFRLAVFQLVASAAPDTEASRSVAVFYGQMLNKDLFPEQFRRGRHSVPELNDLAASISSSGGSLQHPSHGPWLAECARCLSHFINKASKESRRRAVQAAKLTEKLVEKHDNCRKSYLEWNRKQQVVEQTSLKQWQRIVANLCHPLALWHDPRYDPQSLVLENVTGLSGTYVRFQTANSGINQPRFYKEGFQYKSKDVEQRYASFFTQQVAGAIEVGDLYSKADYPDQAYFVEPVQEITPASCRTGELVLCPGQLHVLLASSSSSWSSSISDIDSVSKRRHQLRNVALEVFLVCGESHLIVFRNQTYRDKVAKLLSDAGVPLNPRNDQLQALTKRWRQGRLSNFKYLMELNSLAGRTPNDLMQYPVFPWILADYTSTRLDLTNPASFRNLRRPIAIQHEENISRYETTYRILEQEGTGLPGVLGPYHYASHYSNTGIVLHLLVRVPPFTGEFIKFQDGNFDLADRSFHSLATSWAMVSHVSTSDVKELIPQLFYLPEMLENREGFALGRRQNGKEVDSVDLPPWAPDARIFIKIHRQALESPHVREELSHWIDLVFGYKQRGPAAVEAINVFHPATYAHNLETEVDELERRARQTMIATYGQMPLQLFVAPHPLADIGLTAEKANPLPVYRNITGLRWGNYVGSPAHPQPNVVWQQVQPFQVRTLYKMEMGQVVGLPSNGLLIGNYRCENSSSAGLSSASCGQPYRSQANILTWGYANDCLHLRGRQGEEVQVAELPQADPVVIGASNPKVGSLWLGHQSGRISVYKIAVVGVGEADFSLQPETRLYGHITPITALLLSPEYSLAVSGSSEGSVITWDLYSFAFLHCTSADTTRLEHTSCYFSHPWNLSNTSSVLCAISESCGDIAVAANSTLTLYSVNLSKVCQTTIRGRITAVAFSHLEEGEAANCVLIGTQAGLLRLYSSWDLTHIRDVTGCPPCPILAISYSLDSLSLVVSSQNCVVTILEKSGSHGLTRTPKYLSVQ